MISSFINDKEIRNRIINTYYYDEIAYQPNRATVRTNFLRPTSSTIGNKSISRNVIQMNIHRREKNAHSRERRHIYPRHRYSARCIGLSFSIFRSRQEALFLSRRANYDKPPVSRPKWPQPRHRRPEGSPSSGKKANFTLGQDANSPAQPIIAQVHSPWRAAHEGPAASGSTVVHTQAGSRARAAGLVGQSILAAAADAAPRVHVLFVNPRAELGYESRAARFQADGRAGSLGISRAGPWSIR